MKTCIKVIPQAYLTPTGICRSFGVIINGRLGRVYHSKEEVEAYVLTFLLNKEGKGYGRQTK